MPEAFLLRAHEVLDAEFEAWLDEHVDLRAGVWLKIAKKGSGIRR